ncbi:MAG: tetratricopeptide repeat protein [Bacteroidota bacterium]
MRKAEEYFNKGLSFHNVKDFDNAIIWYEKAIEEDDNYAEPLNNLGALLKSKGEYQKAIDFFKRAITLMPNNVNAYYNWGNTLQDLKKYEESIDYYKKATEINPDYANAYNSWGNALYALQNYEEAIVYYKKAIEADSNFAIAYCNLGDSLRASGRFEESIDCYKKATEINADYADAYNNWGNALYALENYGEAIVCYKKAIEIKSSFAIAYFNIGISLRNIGNYEESIDYYKKATEINADYADAYKNWGRSLDDLGKYEEAIPFFIKATELSPEDVDAYNKWGNALLSLEKYSEAIEKYMHCINLNSKYKFAYYNLAIAYQFDDPEIAIENCNKAIELDSDYDDAFIVLSKCIALVKDNDKHIDELIKYAKDNNSKLAYKELGIIYQYTLNNHGQAQFYYDKFASLSNRREIANDYSGIYYFYGDVENAIRVLDESIVEEGYIENIYLLHNKAHYLWQMGSYEKSRNLWKEVVTLYDKAFNEDVNFKSNSNNFLYQGSIHHEIFGNIDKAERVFQSGLGPYRNNINILVALNRVYSDKDKRRIAIKNSHFSQRSTNVRKAEKIFNNYKYKYEDTYYQMAELYFIEEMYEKSKGVLNEYFKQEFPESSRWYTLQGQLFLADDEFAKAIKSFKYAVKLEGHNMALRINLANAYLKNNDYEYAEKEFLDVLRKDPHNVDALIGLGEINLNRSEDESFSEVSFDTAEKYLLDAVKIGKSIKGSRRLNLHEPKGNGARKYKDLKLSDVYYSLGYINYQKYQNDKLGDNIDFLYDSLRYFSKSTSCNPDNIKAKKSQQKVKNYLQKYQRKSETENFGARLITVFSLIIFVLCQYFFYFHQTEDEVYKLNDDSVDYIGSLLSLDEAQTVEMETLVGVPFKSKDALLNAIEGEVGESFAMKNVAYLDAIYLVESTGEEQIGRIPTGYYALITFGAILFMIAGLYLPRLLKLKVGVIELQKNSLSEVQDSSLLGIQK